MTRRRPGPQLCDCRATHRAGHAQAVRGARGRGRGTSAASSRNGRSMAWGKPRAVDPHPS
eukprot:9665005-Alexandrium_andersonii.AAC.1